MAARELRIRVYVGRTFRLGRLHIGWWAPRFWSWGLRIATPTSWFAVFLGPISIRITR